MKTEFIPTELANEMIKLGFDDFTIFFGDNYKEYLLWQQAFRWFREKYKLHSWIEYHDINWYSIVCNKKYLDNNYLTYEGAELACLKKLIEIAKNK